LYIYEVHPLDIMHISRKSLLPCIGMGNLRLCDLRQKLWDGCQSLQPTRKLREKDRRPCVICFHLHWVEG